MASGRRPLSAPHAEGNTGMVPAAGDLMGAGPPSSLAAGGSRRGVVRMPSSRVSVRGVPRHARVEVGAAPAAAGALPASLPNSLTSATTVEMKPLSPRVADDASALKAGQVRRQVAQGRAHPSMRRSSWFQTAEPKERPGQLPPPIRGVTGIATDRAALNHVHETFTNMDAAANELEEIERDLAELQSDVHASRIAAGGAAPEGTLRYEAAFATGVQLFDAMDGEGGGALPRSGLEETLRADADLRGQLARARSDQTGADWECLIEFLTASDEGRQASEECTTQMFHDLWAEAGLDVGGSGVDDAQSVYDVIQDTVRKVDGTDAPFSCARAALCLKRHKAYLDSLAIARVKLLSRNWMAFLVQVVNPHNRRSDHLSRREFATLWAQSGLGHFLLVDGPDTAAARRASADAVMKRPATSGPGPSVYNAPKPPPAPRPEPRSSGDGGGGGLAELPPARPKTYLGKADSRRLRGQGWFTLTKPAAGAGAGAGGDARRCHPNPHKRGCALYQPAPPQVDYKILLDQQRQDHSDREASLQQYHCLLDHVAKAKRRNADLLRESYMQLGLIEDDRLHGQGARRGSLDAGADGLPQGIGGLLHAITPARPNTPLQQVTRRPHRLTQRPPPAPREMAAVGPRAS